MDAAIVATESCRRAQDILFHSGFVISCVGHNAED